MHNKLTHFPLIELQLKKLFIKSHLPWKIIAVVFSIFILALAILTLLADMRLTEKNNFLVQKNAVLAQAQQQFNQQMGDDYVASLPISYLDQLSGFDEYFSVLTSFKTQAVWLDSMTIDLAPEVQPKIKEIHLSGQTQVPSEAQDFYNRLKGLLPYSNYPLQLNILSNNKEKQQLTKRQLRLMRAKGINLEQDNKQHIFNFTISTPEKNLPDKKKR